MIVFNSGVLPGTPKSPPRKITVFFFDSYSAEKDSATKSLGNFDACLILDDGGRLKLPQAKDIVRTLTSSTHQHTKVISLSRDIFSLIGLLCDIQETKVYPLSFLNTFQVSEGCLDDVVFNFYTSADGIISAYDMASDDDLYTSPIVKMYHPCYELLDRIGLDVQAGNIRATI